MNKNIDAFSKNIPLRYVYLDNVNSNFVTNIVVQNQPEYFTISFFESFIPPILGNTETKRKELLESLKHIDAKCVSKIIVTPQKMKEFIKVMNKNYKNFEESNKQIMHAIKYCPNTNYNNEGLIKYITYPTKKDRVMVHFITDRPKITISLGSDSTNFVSNIMYEDTFGLMLLSEQVLKRDWINPQEDEAWKDL